MGQWIVAMNTWLVNVKSVKGTNAVRVLHRCAVVTPAGLKDKQKGAKPRVRLDAFLLVLATAEPSPGSEAFNGR